ncbi:GNAT family N-acetyltransferase [Govanella unica]|uniref:N-acetyltransferase n=1 Tax=Govanella unica TaxID=2975056 RepID=A0A9X3TXF5_9PROT|nr:N-acetyltransferase [Govania unica]MDA5193147.1 N-acetyltransferase [Govania unica]
MTTSMTLDYQIELQRPEDLAAVESINDRAFGPGRHQKTAYRLREDVQSLDDLNLVARQDGVILGTIRFWPIVIVPGEGTPTPALLLGPIAVDPELKGRGIGIALMRAGIARARELGHRLVLLVGDYDYYARVGFDRVPQGCLMMPGPVDYDRLLKLELVPGAFAGVTGMISRPM